MCSYVRLEDEISIEDEQEDGIKGITSNLQEFDLQLRTLQDTATNMLKDPERVEEFSAIFHETVAAMRKQIVVMEYQSTPANLETMGQFFR